jgi:NAD(P)-dependent dehydrogenase (short-subunit alcohol dehydrogenase family)
MTAQHLPEDTEPLELGANGSAHEISIIPLQREEKKVDLHGKVALIIGGATERGQSLAVAFAERGIHVALVYLNQDHARAAQIKEEVEQRDQQCLLVAGDEDDEDVDELFAQDVMLQILQRFGRLDIFINLSARRFPLGDLLSSAEDQVAALRARIFPHFNMMKAAMDQIAG